MNDQEIMVMIRAIRTTGKTARRNRFAGIVALALVALLLWEL